MQNLMRTKDQPASPLYSTGLREAKSVSLASSSSATSSALSLDTLVDRFGQMLFDFNEYQNREEQKNDKPLTITEQKARERQLRKEAKANFPKSEDRKLVRSEFPVVATESELQEASKSNYLDFSVALILTAIDDIVRSRSIIEKLTSPENTKQKVYGMKLETVLENVRLLEQSAIAWIKGNKDCRFSFEESLYLFHDEMKNRTQGTVSFPDLDDPANQRVVADWILNDPHSARDAFSMCRFQFLRGDKRVDQDDDDFNSDDDLIDAYDDEGMDAVQSRREKNS
jgi:hypothetical protein